MSQGNWIENMRAQHAKKVHVKRDPLFVKKVRIGNTGFAGLVKGELVYSRNNLLGAMEITAAALYGSDQYDADKHHMLKADVLFTSSTSEAVQAAAHKIANGLQGHLNNAIPSNKKGEELRVAGLNAFVRYIEDAVSAVGASKISIEEVPSLMTSRRKGNSPKGKGTVKSFNKDSLLKKLPPCLLRDELAAHGQLKVVTESGHTSGRKNYHINFPQVDAHETTKMSFTEKPTVTDEGLKVILQEKSNFIRDAEEFLDYCLETGRIFPEKSFPNAKAAMDFIQANRRTNSDWSTYKNVAVGAVEFYDIDDWGIARQPLSFSTPNVAAKSAKDLLSDWRKLPQEMINAKMASGDISAGFFHFVKSNSISNNGIYYALKKVSAEAPLTDNSGDYPSRYQIMFRSRKEGSGVKLEKIASGKNRGYFAGYPKLDRDSLVLTESVLDSDSIQVLSQYAAHAGVEVEDNTISLLSTAGLKEFIKQRFHVDIYTPKNGETIKLYYKHPIASDGRGELLNDRQKEHLDRVLFSRKTIYVDDGSSNSERMYRALISLGEAVSKKPVEVNKINQEQQQGAITAEKSFFQGGALFLDATSFGELLKACHLRVDAVDDGFVWRANFEKWSKGVELDKLSSSQQQDLRARVAYQMNDVLKVKGLANGFDNDSGGKKAGRILKKVCDTLNIPFFDIDLPKINVDKGPMNEEKRHGVTEDHNDFLMAVEAARENGDTELATNLVTQWASVMPQRHMKMERKIENDANTRKR